MNRSKGQSEPLVLKSKVAHHGSSQCRDAGCLSRPRISRKKGNIGENELSSDNIYFLQQFVGVLNSYAIFFYVDAHFNCMIHDSTFQVDFFGLQCEKDRHGFLTICMSYCVLVSF